MEFIEQNDDINLRNLFYLLVFKLIVGNGDEKNFWENILSYSLNK